MDEYYEDVEMAINNRFDYSTIVPTAENIAYLIKYCDQVFNSFENLIIEDEEKNKRVKYELQSYNYKKSYSDRFEITIRDKTFNSFTCNKYDSFVEQINSGKVKDLYSLEIRLDMGYKTGTNTNLIEHTNEMYINFKPYEIYFTRKSNFKEYTVDQVEKNINKLLQEFPAVDTIFATKE